MSRVAIVTDSASDLAPSRAAELGITVVPLLVSSGPETSAGVELSAEAFWARMTAPDAPFPTTAAASQIAVPRRVRGGLRGGRRVGRMRHRGGRPVSHVHCGHAWPADAAGARDPRPDRELRSPDKSSWRRVRPGARAGRSGAEIAAELTERATDVEAIVCLDTLEYLRRGGRISGPRAVIGTLLSVKPIIAIRNGTVDRIDQVRTRGKARERAIEFITSRPIERLAIFHSISPDLDEFRSEVIARVATIDAAQVETAIIGPSIGPHLGPGALGAAMLSTGKGPDRGATPRGVRPDWRRGRVRAGCVRVARVRPGCVRAGRSVPGSLRTSRALVASTTTVF